MTDTPFGSPTTPPSSAPYPELRYDGEGRLMGGNPYAVPSGGAPGYGGSPGADPYAHGQYVPGQYSQGPYAAGTTNPSGPFAPAMSPHGHDTPSFQQDYQQTYQQAYGAQTYQWQPDHTLLVVAWIVAALTAFYMLPWAVAVTRRKPDATAIALVTFFTGWTGIGWIVGLVWSLMGDSRPQPPHPGWYPSPTGVGQMFWDGYAWTGHTQP